MSNFRRFDPITFNFQSKIAQKLPKTICLDGRVAGYILSNSKFRLKQGENTYMATLILEYPTGGTVYKDISEGMAVDLSVFMTDFIQPTRAIVLSDDQLVLF